MRIGTIGTGFIVDAIIESGNLVEGVKFVACYSRKIETGNDFAMKHNMEAVFDDMDAFLNYEGIDTVYVASPNSLHYEQTMRALDAGKNVIVEKPFAGNAQGAKEMIDKAKEKNLFLFEAITNIHMPHFDYLKEEIKKIGDLKIIQSNMSQISSRYHALKAGNVTNVFNPEFSGGAIMDLNIYNLHLMVGLLGMPQEVAYAANMHENGIDVSGIAVMKYPNFVVECVGSKDSAGVNFIQIQGDKGYIYVDSSASTLKSVKTVNEQGETTYNVQDKPIHYYEFKDFNKIMEAKDYEACYRLLEHSYDVMEVAEACLEQVGLEYKK